MAAVARSVSRVWGRFEQRLPERARNFLNHRAGIPFARDTLELIDNYMVPFFVTSGKPEMAWLRETTVGFAFTAVAIVFPSPHIF
jgi:CubicO group peptidase (beta-lactamase class C family)